MKRKSIHWADEYAARIIQEKGEKERYTCASGITPSGTVHVGNFREIISVDLVVRALRDAGKAVRFIYSWDDYDVFRKVPANMPQQETLQRYLRFPITDVPDPWGCDENYARHHERAIETLLPLVGIVPEYLYQAQRYRCALYAQGIRQALEKKDTLREILDAFRDEEHKIQGDYWPISVFCTACYHDGTTIESWDGQWAVSYRCSDCGHYETVDLRTTAAVKLLWRVDWPMRWAYEKVDFEPAGKDHHSPGGSFDTARRIAQAVYDYAAPVSFRYDFIGIKGSPGKMSSSTGKVVDLQDLLNVYTPELVRFLFAGTRPNTEFTLSFDLDVLKIYEDYDRTERIAWKLEPVSEELYQKERRIYELSQVEAAPHTMPYQIPFRHLCNLIQIADGDWEKALAGLADLKPSQVQALRARCRCAAYWIEQCAPEEFRFQLKNAGEQLELREEERQAIQALRDQVVARIEQYPDDQSCAAAIYALAKSCGIDDKSLFRLCYQVLIGKDQGPRLAPFLRSINKNRLLTILAAY
ncbi:MAG: lysine--tRNA ligase [Spirochaetaceae bacterium]|jgi:lysyl-tRNA synthetase class 1|nr:lysine--tRNA ligase [Spirochaetaceae bacterium]